MNLPLKQRVASFKLSFEKYLNEEWNKLKTTNPDKVVFYLTTSCRPGEKIDRNTFEFKFGITDNINRRLQQHSHYWNACYENTLVITFQHDGFAKMFESSLKIGKGKSEFRHSMKTYNEICHMFIKKACLEKY